MMPEHGFDVRPAAAADLARLVAMETGPDTARFLGDTGRTFHDRAWHDADQEQLVAWAGADPVGFAVLRGLQLGGGRVELRRIVIANQCRGAGYGRLLFRAVVGRAYQLYGARDVWLDVKPGNARARALYESEGFVDDGEVCDPHEPGGVLLLMARPADAGVPRPADHHRSTR
jgi:ribosomal protein S18 acetylase RimI-like enzyme